jgi:hypothetical protein
MQGFILVEGPTEFNFVKTVLNPFLESHRLTLTPVRVTTSISDRAYKGGSVRWHELQKQLINLIRDPRADIVTTMFDYYRRPYDLPGNDSLPKSGNCYQRIEYLEHEWFNAIDSRFFIPYLALHEFEALLFSDPIATAKAMLNEKQSSEIQSIRDKFASPEEINDQTPPSYHLIKIFPKYDKTIDGPLIIDSIGIELIRQQCPHFNRWLSQLEQIAVA